MLRTCSYHGIPAAIRWFNEVNAELLKTTTPEYRATLYGYAQGWEPDWDDVIDADEARAFLTENLGQPWHTRHD